MASQKYAFVFLTVALIQCYTICPSEATPIIGGILNKATGIVGGVLSNVAGAADSITGSSATPVSEVTEITTVPQGFQLSSVPQADFSDIYGYNGPQVLPSGIGARLTQQRTFY